MVSTQQRSDGTMIGNQGQCGWLCDGEFRGRGSLEGWTGGTDRRRRRQLGGQFHGVSANCCSTSTNGTRRIRNSAS
jgi:hypothetical protein